MIFPKWPRSQNGWLNFTCGDDGVWGGVGVVVDDASVCDCCAVCEAFGFPAGWTGLGLGGWMENVYIHIYTKKTTHATHLEDAVVVRVQVRVELVLRGASKMSVVGPRGDGQVCVSERMKEGE